MSYGFKFNRGSQSPSEANELSSYYVSDGKKDIRLEVHVNDTENENYYFDQGTEQFSDEPKKTSLIRSFIEGFQKVEIPDLDPNLTEMEKSYIYAARAPLKRKLYARHLQMIAIGGSIGAGLFVGSGSALRKGGPASVLIAWLVAGAMMYFTVQALGELAVAYPVSGAFVQYGSRFISPAYGFGTSWLYALGWIISLPLELTATSITIKYWNDDLNPAIFVTIFYIMIIFINIFGVRGYGEAEFVLSLIKVTAIIGFIFLGIILNCGGGPKGGYIGGKYWRDPGAFHNGFKGLCTCFPTAAFSFGGTELVGLTAAEAQNPRKTLPSATKQVFWRIALFYIISLTLIGLLVPYNDERLLSSSSVDAAASPFVIAIKNGGIKGLPSVMNAVIMISVISVGNSAVFATSRSILSLSQQGFGPKCFGYIDKRGRPLVGVGITLVVAALGYLAASPYEGEVFSWLLASSGLSAFVTWGGICFCHLRFRYVLKLRGRGPDELAFAAQAGIWGSLFGFILAILIIISEFWVALFPIGGNGADVKSFFQTWLYVPVIIVSIVGYMIWKRDFRIWIHSRDIDIDTGRGDFDLDLIREEIAEEKEYMASQPWFYRVYKFWC